MAEASQFDLSKVSALSRRQLKKLGNKPLSDEEEEELGQLIKEMGKIYGGTQVCLGQNCMHLEPGLKKIMADSTSYNERTFVWKASFKV